MAGYLCNNWDTMIYKLLKKPFFGRFMVEWRSPITGVERSEWDAFTVNSTSGSKIQAWSAKAKTPQAKGTLVLGHPMGKPAKGYFIKHGYADLYRENGFHVVIFDFNGFGESTVGNFSFQDDVAAVGKEVAKRFPELPLGYHGISLGTQSAALAFTEPDHPFTFAVLESATTSLPEFWKHYPSAYRILMTIKFFMPRYARKIHMVERFPEVKNLDSVLFIYSKTDIYTPLEMGKRYLANSPVPADLWVMEKAGHAEAMASPQKEDYQKRLLDYFNDSVAASHSVL